MLIPFLPSFGTLPKSLRTIFTCLFIAMDMRLSSGFSASSSVRFSHLGRSWLQ
jgi:hypothetical protein